MAIESIGVCPICEIELTADDVIRARDSDDGTRRLARCELCGHVIRPERPG